MSIINEIYYNIESILTEGVSEVVYHFTYLRSLLNILKENKFHASTNIGGSADAGNISKEKPYFFSTQRSGNKNTGWAKGTSADVSIALDGRKLNQRYKGFPVDYWGWSKNRKDWNSDYNYRQALLSNEFEDRIVLDEPTIDNAIDYILEIHIYLDPKSKYTTHPDVIKELRRYNALYKNIPFYFYGEIKDFENQNKANAIDAKQLQAIPDAEELHHSTYDSASSLVRSVLPLLAYNDKKNKFMVIDYLNSIRKEGSNENMEEFIDDKTKDLYHKINIYPYDVIGTLSADIHNNRSNPDEKARTIIKMLIDDMKKLNAPNLQHYVDIKAGVKEATPKEKPVKQTTILWDDQLQDHLSWSKYIWSYIDVDDFWWGTLPSNNRSDPNMVKMVNNDGLTFKQFTTQTMPLIGKEKIKKLFAKNEISFKNISPDDGGYDFYLKDWQKQ